MRRCSPRTPWRSTASCARCSRRSAHRYSLRWWCAAGHRARSRLLVQVHVHLPSRRAHHRRARCGHRCARGCVSPGPTWRACSPRSCSFPVLHWNATHDWISFRFQIQHGLGTPTWLGAPARARALRWTARSRVAHPVRARRGGRLARRAPRTLTDARYALAVVAARELGLLRLQRDAALGGGQLAGAVLRARQSRCSPPWRRHSRTIGGFVEASCSPRCSCPRSSPRHRAAACRRGAIPSRAAPAGTARRDRWMPRAPRARDQVFAPSSGRTATRTSASSRTICPIIPACSASVSRGVTTSMSCGPGSPTSPARVTRSCSCSTSGRTAWCTRRHRVSPRYSRR